ncbi:MAG TPA: hypothetical protein PK629_00350 [Oscillospiraceae bacterium]|nr:hypothetical protein [Oscillospiraceae bacterium]HPK36136.1 hypothetical protein [Oscillospiraceae bacterium]HPR76707.1 hypothetical protein [Oscillospiraceae bacterium]
MKKPLIILFCLIIAILTIGCQTNKGSEVQESSISANSFYENGSFEYEWGNKVAEISYIYQYDYHEYYFSDKFLIEIMISVNVEEDDYGFEDECFVYIDNAGSIENLVHVFFADPSVTGERMEGVIFLGERYALIGGEVIFDMDSREKYSIPFLETFDENNTEEISEGTAKYVSNCIYDPDNNRLIYIFTCGYIDENNDLVMYDYLYTYDLSDIANPSEANWTLIGKYLAEIYNTEPYFVDLQLNEDGTVTYREYYDIYYKVDIDTGVRSPVIE